MSPPSTNLNPEMVYRPQSPPALGPSYEDDGDVKRLSLRIHMFAIIRAAIVGLAISSIVILAVRRGFESGPSIGIFVLLIFIIPYNLFLLLPSTKHTNTFPRISFQCGDFSCVLNGKDGEESRVTKSDKEVGALVARMFDFAFGLTVTVLACK
jgi:thiamine transporter ThiT